MTRIFVGRWLVKLAWPHRVCHQVDVRQRADRLPNLSPHSPFRVVAALTLIWLSWLRSAAPASTPMGLGGLSRTMPDR